MTLWRNLVVALVAAFVLTACGGSSDTAVAPPPPPEPTPQETCEDGGDVWAGGSCISPQQHAYNTAAAAIATATTAAAAQAAYDAVQDDVTAAQGAMLQAAVDSRVAALAMMDRAAEQRVALMTAAGAIDTSDLTDADAIAAANTAIAALKAAIAAAVDVDDTSMYDAQVTAAETLVAAAQGRLDHAAQTAALSGALTALQAIDLTGLSTQEAIDAAQAAIDALQRALDNATELSATEKTAANIELAAANRAVASAQGRTDMEVQMMAISDAVKALGEIDLTALSTQEAINAANAAIMALKAALDDATDLTNAQKLDGNVELELAERAVTSAQTALDENVGNQRTALTDAGTALGELDLDDLDTAEKIAAANEAVAALKAALDGATHLSDSEKAAYQTQLNEATEDVRMAQTGMDRTGRRTAQMDGLTNASNALTTALNALAGDDAPTQAQIDAAETALAALNTAIERAEDLTDAEKADAMRAVAVAEGRIAGAKQARMVADAADQKAADDKAKADAAEMAKTAAKLYAGIAAQSGDVAGTTAAGTALAADTERGAAYNNVDVPESGVAVATRIMVGIGTATPVALTEDKKAPDAKLHGWEGKRYTAEPDNGGMYEAMVYSNVGDPTMGAKFNGGASGDGAVGFDLDSGSTDTVTMTAALNVGSRIVSPRFTHTAGTYTPKLPDPNPRSESTIPISGSYYGVAGTYTCTPATGTGCGVVKATEGYTFADPTAWTFKATNPNARVTEMPDSIYASYGWWIHMSEDGATYTASAFVDDKGEVPDASGLDTLQGTATYRGGAAGKYALSSSTGGTNDAGHFTARATLNADFSDDSITGTIDNFMGADGTTRDWSVELKEAAIAATGGIARADDDDTAWTIGGTAAAASGEWSGSLQDNGDDGVPKVGTGTFYSTYGQDGKLVGAFGVTKQ